MSYQDTTSPSTPSQHLDPEDPANCKCICGKGDGTGDYIWCDNPTCTVGWYHWRCVQVTEEPVGDWICPTCSPSAAHYVGQLVKERGPSAVVPKVEGPRGKSQERGRSTSTPAPKPKKTVESTRSKGKERESEGGKKGTARKGLAAKKSVPEKPKPKWRGWVEMTSDGEEDFKKTVDAQWEVEDVSGPRRRASKAFLEESEPSSRGLRTLWRSGGKITSAKSSDSDEMDKDEDSDKEQDKDVQEEVEVEESVTPFRRGASIRKIVSDDSEESENSMDVDQRPQLVDSVSPLEPSTPPSDLNEDMVQTNTLSDQDDGEEASEFELNDLEDSMDIDMEHPEDAIEANDDADDDDDASGSFRTAPEFPQDHQIAQSPRPERASTSPASEASRPATRHEDIIDIDEEDEGHEVQRLVTASPALEGINFAGLYERQGDRWGVYPESSIRSTLPRLG